MLYYFGKTLIFIGFLLIFVGIVFLFGLKIPYFGRLPGDVYIKKGNFQFYFPFGTCVLISFIVSAIFYLIYRFFK